jgi:hypothetical protein
MEPTEVIDAISETTSSDTFSQLVQFVSHLSGSQIACGVFCVLLALYVGRDLFYDKVFARVKSEPKPLTLDQMAAQRIFDKIRQYSASSLGWSTCGSYSGFWRDDETTRMLITRLDGKKAFSNKNLTVYIGKAKSNDETQNVTHRLDKKQLAALADDANFIVKRFQEQAKNTEIAEVLSLLG